MHYKHYARWAGGTAGIERTRLAVLSESKRFPIEAYQNTVFLETDRLADGGTSGPVGLLEGHIREPVLLKEVMMQLVRCACQRTSSPFSLQCLS